MNEKLFPHKSQKRREEEIKMENKLNRLFDYQRFEKNRRLERLIEEAESHRSTALSDEELMTVTAAGAEPTLGSMMFLLHKMGLYPDEELVRELMERGGYALRDWAKYASNGSPMANMIPGF